MRCGPAWPRRRPACRPWRHWPPWGDAWGWIACRPMDQLVLAWGVGTRPLGAARQLVAQLQAATAGHLPCFPREALPPSAKALLAVDGVWMPPRRWPPPALCDASVVQERKDGRGIHVTTRVGDGTIAQVEAALQASPVRWTINTDGVERHKLTVRQQARRRGRQGTACPKSQTTSGSSSPSPLPTITSLFPTG